MDLNKLLLRALAQSHIERYAEDVPASVHAVQTMLTVLAGVGEILWQHAND